MFKIAKVCKNVESCEKYFKNSENVTSESEIECKMNFTYVKQCFTIYFYIFKFNFQINFTTLIFLRKYLMNFKCWLKDNLRNNKHCVDRVSHVFSFSVPFLSSGSCRRITRYITVTLIICKLKSSPLTHLLVEFYTVKLHMDYNETHRLQEW